MGSESEYIAFTTSLSETFKINGKESILCPFCVFMMKLLREFHIVSSTMRLCYFCMSASTGWTSNFRLSFKKWSSRCFKFYGPYSIHSISHALVILFSGIESQKTLAVHEKKKEVVVLRSLSPSMSFWTFQVVLVQRRKISVQKRHDRRSPKVNTLRIKLYRAILYNFNCKIYIMNFVQHLRKIPFSSDALAILNQTIQKLSYVRRRL